MCRYQCAGMILKRCAVCREADRAGRAFDQPLLERRLQPLQLHADAGLRRSKDFRGAGEALQVGHQQEGLYCWDVQRGHFIIMYRYD